MNNLYANGFGTTSSDPFNNINYQQAFDCHELEKKFGTFIENLKNNAQGVSQKEIEAYQKASLAQLRSARRHCLTKDARNELTYLLVNIAAVAATMRFLPKDSMGGSFSIFHAAMGSAYTLPSIIQTVYNFTFSPANSLEDLENHFALEKCFIPEMLHSTIIQKFCTARTNQFEHKHPSIFLNLPLA